MCLLHMGMVVWQWPFTETSISFICNFSKQLEKRDMADGQSHICGRCQSNWWHGQFTAMWPHSGSGAKCSMSSCLEHRFALQASLVSRSMDNLRVLPPSGSSASGFPHWPEVAKRNNLWVLFRGFYYYYYYTCISLFVHIQGTLLKKQKRRANVTRKKKLVHHRSLTIGLPIVVSTSSVYLPMAGAPNNLNHGFSIKVRVNIFLSYWTNWPTGLLNFWVTGPEATYTGPNFRASNL